VLRLAIIAVGLALWCTGAQAQRYMSAGAQHETRPGITTKIFFVTSVYPDCSSQGVPAVRITQQPRLGKVSIVRSRYFTEFPRSSRYYVCNSRRVPGIAVNYRVPRGLKGPDSVSIGVVFPSGTTISRSVDIIVR
jgi:hypothetical protein